MCRRFELKKHMLRARMSLFLTVYLAACLHPAGIATPDPPTGPGKHVLFVGNSITYTNQLPGILEALADSAGLPLLETAMLAYPNFSLEDHWNDGRAATTIRKGGWHHVVLQQGPSSVEANRQLLIQFASAFNELATAHGAASALYMVWPTSDRQQDFDRASESYRLAAQAVNGLLFPVGDAWRETWARDATITLYGPDGLHPSVEGSYLAALVMFGALYDRTPVGLPRSLRLRNGATFSISAARAATLQQAAATVLMQ
jgi:hypothetical protein